MNNLDALLPFLDNGGRRLYIERRKRTEKYSLINKRLTTDRRNSTDRRERLNLRCKNSLERRFFYRNQNEYGDSYHFQTVQQGNKIILLKNYRHFNK